MVRLWDNTFPALSVNSFFTLKFLVLSSFLLFIEYGVAMLRVSIFNAYYAMTPAIFKQAVTFGIKLVLCLEGLVVG